MIVFKILAYMMIVQGVVFTILAVYVTIVVEEWFDIVIGLIVLGPISLIVGILIIRKMKPNVKLEALKKTLKK